jgi:hypothetical protein
LPREETTPPVMKMNRVMGLHPISRRSSGSTYVAP